MSFEKEEMVPLIHATRVFCLFVRFLSGWLVVLFIDTVSSFKLLYGTWLSAKDKLKQVGPKKRMVPWPSFSKENEG